MKLEKKYGYVNYSKDDCNENEIVIDHIEVNKGFRNKGYGKKLMIEVIDIIKNIEGIESIGLYAEPQSEDGLAEDLLIQFYRDLGFDSDGDCNNLMSMSI